jgi:hypothetical protein
MLTFEEWYKSNYPELDPELDDCYKMLMKCYECGYDYGVWMATEDGPEM